MTVLILSFVGLSLVFVFGFKRDPDNRNYILSDKKITNLRESSSQILEDLLKQNNVTFDPTNGVAIETVLENLKCSIKKKVLLLGSSQLITLNDDWSSDNYLRRVDKMLETMYDDGVIVYNLSMGGMTVPEKKIVLDKVQEIMEFDKIIMSIGPYDCRETEIRPSIEKIETIPFNRMDKEGCVSLEHSQILNNVSIDKVNSSIENIIERWFAESTFFFDKKGAIKLWTAAKVNSLMGNKPFYSPKKSLSWRTNNQKLNDVSGWATDMVHSGKKSLKIIKEDKETNSSWGGFKVDLRRPTKKIVLGGWSKSENVVGAKLYCLDFKIDFIDGTYEWVYEGLEFEKGTNDWTQKENVLQFEKDILSITPKLLLYKGSGVVWFDDIYARPIYDKVGENVVLNQDIEEESRIKDVHSLSFEENVWENIFENAIDLVEHAGTKTNDTGKYYILIPPAYHSPIKKGYEQEFMLEKFKSELEKACKRNNIQLLDANELLDEAHFIEYESGDRKGMIEPLHFDTEGHKKLAEYLKDHMLF
ncbi:hypothetical protein V1387_02865 [Allomuricauda taeanensis]|uniref:hypothetical protein n=1 Tax=Flagellimonas taeanensis TaxID=1005926 RepID=UPI002E7B1E31|nr:hypothetical protein [Allomuricauda taeanensis]MEE1961611.1 hypothetical protein [Allomuricauda taeanensis]